MEAYREMTLTLPWSVASLNALQMQLCSPSLVSSLIEKNMMFILYIKVTISFQKDDRLIRPHAYDIWFYKAEMTAGKSFMQASKMGQM